MVTPGIENMPVSRVAWVDRDTLKANHYNPNKVAPPELRLLKISILEDGWTMPIVVLPDMTIVDGFHRWTVSADPAISTLTGDLVPVVVVSLDDTHRMMSTIRHNRARGTHGVLPMADIIQTMIEEGVSQQEIERRLQMEDEEVLRLASRNGIPQKMIEQEQQFGKAWVPGDN